MQLVGHRLLYQPCAGVQSVTVWSHTSGKVCLYLLLSVQAVANLLRLTPTLSHIHLVIATGRYTACPIGYENVCGYMILVKAVVICLTENDMNHHILCMPSMFPLENNCMYYTCFVSWCGRCMVSCSCVKPRLLSVHQVE